MKSEILILTGFDWYRSLKIIELKPLLKKSIKQLEIDFRAVRLDEYVNRFNEIKSEDYELFNLMLTMKCQQRKQHQSLEKYKQSLKIYKWTLFNSKTERI